MFCARTVVVFNSHKFRLTFILLLIDTRANANSSIVIMLARCYEENGKLDLRRNGTKWHTS